MSYSFVVKEYKKIDLKRIAKEVKSPIAMVEWESLEGSPERIYLVTEVGKRRLDRVYLDTGTRVHIGENGIYGNGYGPDDPQALRYDEVTIEEILKELRRREQLRPRVTVTELG